MQQPGQDFLRVQSSLPARAGLHRGWPATELRTGEADIIELPRNLKQEVQGAGSGQSHQDSP
jgi:hypothetical protein